MVVNGPLRRAANALLSVFLYALLFVVCGTANAATFRLQTAGARALNLPYPIVEGEPFDVRVGWRLPPGISASSLHVELKDARYESIQFHVLAVGARGDTSIRFTAPSLGRTPSVQIAAWLGTDWRTPLAPIWFSPQIWLESRRDAAKARARRAEWLKTARRIFRRWPSSPASTAALLDDASLSTAGHREASAVGGALSAAGYHVVRLDAEQVVNPFILDRSRIRLLALTDSARLPVDLGPALEAYIHEGGSLALFGAPAWREAVERVLLRPDVARRLKLPAGLAWIDTTQYDEAAGHVPAEHLLSAFRTGSLDGWRQNINPGAAPALYSLQREAGHLVLHSLVAHLSGWATYTSPPLAMPFGPGQTLTSFRARGDGHTPRLSIEWTEKDGSRWIATVPLSERWQTYSLEPTAFHYWPSVNGRGGRGDQLHPENASRVSFGLAFTHTGQTPGRFEWWVSDFGVSKNPLGDLDRPAPPAIPPADGLFPDYRFFQAHDVARILAENAGSSLPAPDSHVSSLPLAGHTMPVYSLQPRPTGRGFNKGRPWRFEPILVARGPRGEWRGIPAALILHTDDEYRGGVWLSCAIRDAAFYRSPAMIRFLTRQFQVMKHGVYLEDAGSSSFTNFPGQSITLGARIVNLGAVSVTTSLSLRVIAPGALRRTLFRVAWTVPLVPGESISRSATWQPPAAYEPGVGADGVLGVAETTLRSGGFEDTLANDVGVWRPPARPQWIVPSAGQFQIDGRPWKVHGVNYLPSSGIGQDDPALFEQWLSPQAYDPSIVERDLERIKSTGLNAVSVFQYHEDVPSGNLLDLLRRCRNLGLHADVSLRPGEPLHFLWPEIRDIIRQYHLQENDTVFAYDIAWEPSLGDQQSRTEWDPLWRAWILDRYGSDGAAEKEWGFPAPREKGVITNPPTEQLYQDGPWKRLALAYRRFADELVARNYEESRRLIKSIDPNHSVSFRMTETSNPTDDWAGTLSFDFAGVAPAVDFLAPEGYGRIGGWEQVKPGRFERAYGRWVAPEKPLDWKEVGTSVWDLDRMQDDPIKLKDQAAFFNAFYRMMELSGSSGLFYWWYPGGFRVGENSDFGIINPDGTDRPATVVIRDHAKSFLAAPMPPPPNAWITFDPNRRSSGIYGIYQDSQAEFWKLAAEGKEPGLRTPGTGTTSANCPAVAVGGGPWTGHNPSQYLDGLIFGPGTLVNSPGTVFILNVGEAAWLRGVSPGETGTVWLVDQTGDGTEHRISLPANIPHLDSATINLPAGKPLHLYLEVTGRGRISDIWNAP